MISLITSLLAPGHIYPDARSLCDINGRI